MDPGFHSGVRTLGVGAIIWHLAIIWHNFAHNWIQIKQIGLKKGPRDVRVPRSVTVPNYTERMSQMIISIIDFNQDTDDHTSEVIFMYFPSQYAGAFDPKSKKYNKHDLFAAVFGLSIYQTTCERTAVNGIVAFLDLSDFQLRHQAFWKIEDIKNLVDLVNVRISRESFKKSEY